VTYYHYVSDAKVNMLYPEIPKSFLKKIAPEIRILLGALGLNLKERQDPLQTEETKRYDRLLAVVKFIEEDESVGTIDNPKDYFKGTLSMHHAILKERVALFGGKTDKTFLLLSGSPHHMTHESRELKMGSPAMIDDMTWVQQLEDASKISLTDKEAKKKFPFLRFVVDNMKGPKYNLEFLAMNIYHTKIPAKSHNYLSEENLLLGSPIYVSLPRVRTS